MNERRVVVGVDSGNTKTELVAATVDGSVIARARGPGCNSHAVGAAAVAELVARLVADARLETPVDHGIFYLCGADVPDDVAGLQAALEAAGVARRLDVDNDTVALLRAGTERPDAVAVICGAGINCVGRAAGGRVVRYPALGWETGDWGGAEMLGREALFVAARAEDGRGAPSVLAEIARRHFGAPSVEAVGVDVHYRRLPQQRLGELAPLVVAAAADGDAAAGALVDRLAGEIGLWADRAFRDLGISEADVVLGGGMLRRAHDDFLRRVLERLPAGATPVLLDVPPVLGAALAALDAVGATDAAKLRLRSELGGG